MEGKILFEYNLLPKTELKKSPLKLIFTIIITILVINQFYYEEISTIISDGFSIIILFIIFAIPFLVTLSEAKRRGENIKKYFIDQKSLTLYALLIVALLLAVYNIYKYSLKVEASDIFGGAILVFISLVTFSLLYFLERYGDRKTKFYGDSHYVFTDQGIGIKTKEQELFYTYNKMVWVDVPDNAYENIIHTLTKKDANGNYLLDIKLDDGNYINIKIKPDFADRVANILKTNIKQS